MPWQTFFQHLYERFLFRDFAAKVVPGSIVLVAGLVAASDREAMDRVIADVTNQHGAVVAILLGASWLMGWVAQGLRELLIERVGICIGFCPPVDWVQIVAQRTRAKLDDSAEITIERLTVIKEATGNFAAAIVLAGAGLYLGEQWRDKYWVPAVTAFVLLAYKFFDMRRRELRMQELLMPAPVEGVGTGGDWGDKFLRRLNAEPPPPAE